jgi:Zn-dependent peptidase ImmA (M78 family)
MCNPEPRDGNELERLCDLAASELLMPLEEFRSVTVKMWAFIWQNN